MTEIRAGLKGPFRIGLLTGVLAIIIVLGIQFALLRELSVFNTGLGLWVLATEFVAIAALLLALVLVGSFLSARVQRQSGTRTPWVVYYILLGLACFAAFTLGMNNGLTFDVKYSTYATKAETLTTTDKLTISTTPLGKPITVVVDNSTTPFTVLSVQ